MVFTDGGLLCLLLPSGAILKYPLLKIVCVTHPHLFYTEPSKPSISEAHLAAAREKSENSHYPVDESEKREVE